MGFRLSQHTATQIALPRDLLQSATLLRSSIPRNSWFPYALSFSVFLFLYCFLFMTYLSYPSSRRTWMRRRIFNMRIFQPSRFTPLGRSTRSQLTSAWLISSAQLSSAAPCGFCYTRGARSSRWCGWWGRRGRWGRGWVAIAAAKWTSLKR